MSDTSNEPECDFVEDETLNSSRIQTLLKSNVRLLDSEESTLRTKRASHVGLLAEIDDRIAQLEKALEELDQEREVASKDISKYKRLLTPTRRLPNDVLHEIFLHCISEATFDFSLHASLLPAMDQFFFGQSQHLNEILIHVCSSWRTAGLECRGLWTHIGLRVGPILPPPKHTFLLLQRIKRAGPAPLSIVLDIQPRFAANNPLLPILFVSSSCWRKLFIGSRSWRFWEKLAPIRGSLEQLEILLICGQRSESIDIFQFAPKLHSLRTHIGSLERLELPWEQITHFSNVHESAIDPGPLLSNAPMLQVCRLSISEADFTGYHLENLRALTICVNSLPTALAPMLDSLQTPSLTELHIWSSLIEPSCIMNLVTRSQCSLTALRLSEVNISLSAETLLELLITIPTLHILALSADKCFTSLVLERLTYHHDGIPQALGRSLTTLILHGTLPCRPHSFAKMVESRDLHGSVIYRRTKTGVGAKLQSVKLDTELAFSARDVQLLKKICNKGMKFHNGNAEYRPA
ncbi:hypothetical protein C8J56DRAFT_893062 [Mycena floridula]|nr:hypothetical protein C8J56DRAFT_893062 [Mycena floridula]